MKQSQSYSSIRSTPKHSPFKFGSYISPKPRPIPLDITVRFVTSITGNKESKPIPKEKIPNPYRKKLKNDSESNSRSKSPPKHGQSSNHEEKDKISLIRSGADLTPYKPKTMARNTTTTQSWISSKRNLFSELIRMEFNPGCAIIAAQKCQTINEAVKWINSETRNLEFKQSNVFIHQTPSKEAPKMERIQRKPIKTPCNLHSAKKLTCQQLVRKLNSKGITFRHLLENALVNAKQKELMQMDSNETTQHC